ncbi:MAG: metal ABC transporter substrate-binding protein [Armatimonadia bacterium]
MQISRLLIIFTAALAAWQAGAKPLVIASFPDMAALTRSVAGDLVDMQVVMPPGADPHAFTITGDQVRSLGKASLLVLAYSRYHEFEAIVHSALGDTPTLDWPDYVKEGARVYDYPDYPQNPHGPWLRFENARAIARTVAARLVQMGLPAEVVQTRLALFEQELSAQQDMAQRLAAQSSLKPLLAVIPGVCDTIANLNVPVAGVLMQEGSGNVTGQRLSDAIARLRSGQYGGLVCPISMKDSRQGQAAQQIARDSGGRVAWVRFMDTNPQRDTYLSVAAYNTAALAALGTQETTAASLPGLQNQLCYLLLGLLALAVLFLTVRLLRRRCGPVGGAGIFDK